MLRLLIYVLILLAGGAVIAQDDPPLGSAPLGPVGSVEAGDFRALAVTADGQRLLIADAENDQLRVYNFSDPANPTLISSVDLDGEPTAVTAADSFALVAVSTPDEGDAVRVIAPSRYSRPRGYVEANSIDVPDGVSHIAISPDQYWALALSDDGYTLLELVSAGEINSLPMSLDVVDAAVGGDTAYLLTPSALVTESLRVNLEMQRAREITLDGTGQRVLINPRLTLGVIALDSSRLQWFDPAALDLLASTSVNGTITDMQFISAEDAEWLALSLDGSPDITLLDVTDPANVGDLGTLETQFETPVQAMTTFGEYIVATDGQTVRIFQR